MLIDNAISKMAADETLRRFAETKKERDNTRRGLKAGNLINVNTEQRLERRKIRLVNNKGVANAMGEGVAATLSAGPFNNAPINVVKIFEGIVDGTDIQPAWFLTRGTQIRRSVGRIHIRTDGGRRGSGSGFLVGPNLLLTNRHVLETVSWARRSFVEFEYEETYEGMLMKSAYFKLRPDIVYISDDHIKGLDFVLVAVEYRPLQDSGLPECTLAEFGMNHLVSESGKLIKGEPINIIHHPGGQPRQVSIRNNKLLAIEDDVLEQSWMHYETDTLSGSSGSPLFNNQWEVVGLHHVGLKRKDNEGHILAIGGERWEEFMGEELIWYDRNEGLRISRFLAEIRARLSQGVNTTIPEKQTIFTSLGEKLIQAMLTPSSDIICQELPAHQE